MGSGFLLPSAFAVGCDCEVVGNEQFGDAYAHIANGEDTNLSDKIPSKRHFYIMEPVNGSFSIWL